MSEAFDSGVERTADIAVSAVTENPAEAAALTCGARLRAAREQRQLSHADVAQRLKYAARQVQALESGDYEALPGLTFQRGFVRGYARLVGLDANELVTLLEREVGRDNGPTTTQLQQIAYAPAILPAHAESTSAWPWMLGMLLAVVGIGGYTLYNREAPAPGVQSSASNAVSEIAPMGTPAVPTPTLSGANPDTQVERAIQLPKPIAEIVPPAAGTSGDTTAVIGPTAAGGSGAANKPVPGTSMIYLKFTGESWVEVREGNGNLAYAGTNGAGAEQWIDGQPPFDLVVGNARVVKLLYRGAEVKLEPYTKVTVARLQLK